MTFSEVRSYQVGDDVRDIDWNVTARHASPFIKIFEEERELTLMLLIDLTGSTLYGTQEVSKREFMGEVAASLAFSALQNNDRVGAIFFTDQIELFIPARSGRKHILYIIRELLGLKPRGKRTDLALPISYLMRTIKKRCTAFLLSDFMQEPEQYRQSLNMASRKHDLIALRVFDPSEATLPRLGLIELEDSESGEMRWVDSSSRAIRQQYENAYQNRLQATQQLCKRSAVDMVDLPSDQDYANELIKLFKRRN